MVWSQIAVASETWVTEPAPEGPLDFGRAVQYEPPAHPGRGAGIDLVKQRRAEQVCAIHGLGEKAGPGIERALIVVVGIVEPDCRPASPTDTRLPGHL